MFPTVQILSENNDSPDWQPILDAFNQKPAENTEKGFLVSCQIEYKDLNFGKELGQGSFGIVYQGSYQFGSVAIKKLQIGNLSPEAHEEFRKEADMMAQLRHPNIVHFYGYCSIPRCLVMEYMPKGSLFSVLQDKTQALDWDVRIRIAIDMVSGLAFLHSKSILHRDIKSLNILLDDQKAKLTDFGLSKVKNETKSLTKNHQKSKELVGTLPWIAPELFEREQYTYKSDIYSLGITFWELASRKIPYAEDTPEAIPVFVGRGKREAIPSDCPEKLAHLIQQCWAGNPESRPSASDIAKFMTTDAKTLEEASHRPTAAISISTSAHILDLNLQASPAAVPAGRRGSGKLNLTGKEEQEKTQHVLEELRTFFIEERYIGEKTENYAIYNEYLKKDNNNALLAYNSPNTYPTPNYIK
ncbi:MAG TPA: protein kinase [Gammaproteobacteria bacterium]|nr:protein kinase [Gammaproteobacteria bacterium]HQZ87424.1 protein kinase [Gammaproteobacteria bacterium]HRA42582.1 protein kinase [Gammaproteobacteria bacterium]